MAALSLEAVLERVEVAARAAGRSSGEIDLVAVSKARTVQEVLDLYQQGHRDFGENRAQEMAEKAAKLPADIRWHFIGSLQANKVRLVRPNTFLLHSMDRESLAVAWLKGPGRPPPVLVQVNVGLEPQKSGVTPSDAESLVQRLEDLGMEVRGLMAIPPAPDDAEDSRRHFAALRRLRDEIVTRHPSVRALSMGMTDDFEVAISEGASTIRVGRAIFGPRRYPE